MINKNVFSSSVGTLIEWAEFTFYAYMMFRFSYLFFPELKRNLALLATFSTFAVSYLARPLGAVIYGHWGDRYGRKKALSASMLMMGWVTLAMGLLPTYASIGLLSPALLILLRFLQGIAVSGEFTGAAVFISEGENQNNCWATSWVSTSSAAGMLIGALFSVLVSMPFMPGWAWRIPFVLAFFACLIGKYVRCSLPETKEFIRLSKIDEIKKFPLLAVFKSSNSR